MLKRKITGFDYCDLMWCYPLFTCQDWTYLFDDLENIDHDPITVSAVVDPFGDYDFAYLHRCFKDVVIPFKEHFIVDLHRPMKEFVSSHHQRYARKSLQVLDVERCQNPSKVVDEWCRLYANLIKRHNIKGLQAFSRTSFLKQLEVPGVVVFRAIHEDSTVGMLLWYIQNDMGYYHLGAFSDLGYEMRASHALFWTAINYFAERSLRWLNLGAGAGVKNDNNDGLSRFKRGWCTDTRTAYFCGRVFDHARYAEVVKAKNVTAPGYFPKYRTGEFI